MKEEQVHMNRMFAETARALASAIDAKDRYTHGHSSRVADYSREIARREIENGSGTQFDPKYAKIMLEMIDEDKEYKMKV